jgi:2-oxoglutarate dehydrogenase E1 component
MNQPAADARDPLAFLNAGNITFISELYQRYLTAPTQVEADWQAFFADLGEDERSLLADIQGPNWATRQTKVIGVVDPDAPKANGKAKAAPATAIDLQAHTDATERTIKVIGLVRAYRVLGHHRAKLDPLGLKTHDPIKELDPAFHGLTEDDYDRPIYVGGVLGFGDYDPTLNEVLERLNATYCGSVGVEYMHIQDPAQKSWIQERIEVISNHTDFTLQGKTAIFERIVDAESFEAYLDKKFKGTKRFGLDGGEALMPAMEQILKRGGQLGIDEVVIGMPHRGRLNVLANVMNKAYATIFAEFKGHQFNVPDDVVGSGDVKYHLGASDDREFDGNKVHLSLTANPSHLEAVNPVVAGKVRAKQMQKKDDERERVMPILLHGDAAFAGQGVVAETLEMSELKGYRVGGTIHLVVNNQIGFTTNPSNARSGPYCTDIAKMIAAPILHVNGDDPEAVVHVARIATEFRQQFKKDIVVDLFCYRRFGHNEGDEPRFSQPLMYKAIEKHPKVSEIYAAKLIGEGTLSAEAVSAIRAKKEQELDEAFGLSDTFRTNEPDMLRGMWEDYERGNPDDGPRRGVTGIKEETYERLGRALTSIPADFNLNSKLTRLIKAKQDMFSSGEGFDWGTAESLAFASLLDENHPIRFSGQDVRRGTFSHRHAALIDQMDETPYLPLNNLRDDQQAFIEIFNSHLSEYAVLGFEYGFSTAEPNGLTLWEAQFGDFANGAQIMIDQFIASAESKWLRFSGLVMLLPHGFEGQGPEHSSARIERFLQMSAEDNWQIVNCTTPANYFHVLRRQIHRRFRKPLVVFSPKSLLRHKQAQSQKHEFLDGSTFHRLLWDDSPACAPEQVRRVILCSGKVYYDIKAAAQEQGVNDVYVMRVEQLYPFPKDALLEELKVFKNAEFVWCQEEPKNMGAWTFIDPRLEDTLIALGATHTRAGYAGRPEAASPATGSASKHAAQQTALVTAALTGPVAR